MPKEILTKGGAIVGNLDSKADVAAAGDVTAGDDVTAADDVTAGDDITATDQVTGADLNASDDLVVGDDATITDDLAAGSVKAGTGSKIDKMLIGTVAVDPGSINATTRGSKAVTVTGALAGDVIVMNPPSNLEAGLLFCGAYVSATDEVTVMLYNPTGAPVDGASLTWTYLLMSPEA